jgi:O-antigen ligase
LGPASAWLPWLGWAFLAGVCSAQPYASLAVIARWSAALAFMSLAAEWGAGERDAWFVAALAAGAILSLAALWTGVGRGFRAEMTGLIPPYYNYTTFAVSAAVAAAAAWALHPGTSRGFSRAAAIAVAGLGAACLILAHGRGAQLGVVVAALVWATRRWGAKAGIAGLVVLTLAAGVFESNLLPESWRADIVHHGTRYQGARPEIWRGAEAIADDHPWFGAGPGSFGAIFRLHPAEARGEVAARWGMDTDYAHSEPLQAAAETGWAGLALWLAAMGVSFSFLRSRSDGNPVREAAVAASVAMGVHLAVDNMLQIPALAILFFSTLAVAGPSSGSGRRWPRAAAFAGMVLALVGWIPRALADSDPARAAVLYSRDSHPREDLAYRAMATGKNAEADALWAQAEERAPFDAVYPWRRAQIAAAEGRWDAAEKAAARAAVLEPFFLNDRVLRAEALFRLGRETEAKAELAAILAALRDRGARSAAPGYETVVWDFDRAEYDRISALSGRTSIPVSARRTPRSR